jgi:putative ABC transport system substrate-binding protein
VAVTAARLSLVVTVSILAASLAVSLTADAQLTGKVHRIGYLSSGSATTAPHLREAFRQGLRELGWVEGQNIVIDYRRVEGRLDRLPDLAAELVRLKVDIIVTAGTTGVAAAKNATATIPIVMIAVSDPVRTGLIQSLAHPGGNVTGLSLTPSVETYGKALGLLKEAVPKVRRVAILSNPANTSHALAITNVKGAAPSMGVQLYLLEARSPNEFDDAFVAMARERVGALLVVSDPLFVFHRTRLADLAARSRLPAAYHAREYVEAGGLMSYGPSFSDQYRRAAIYVDKILKGREACRSARRAAHEVRAGDESQDREGDRANAPVVAACAGGPGDRMISRCPTSTLQRTGGSRCSPRPLSVRVGPTGDERQIVMGLTQAERAAGP